MSYVWLYCVIKLSLICCTSVRYSVARYVGFFILFCLFNTFYFSQFSSLFRSWDWTSSDGNLHFSPRGNDQHGSLHTILHEPWRARSSPFTFGSFKSVSGNFILFLQCLWFSISLDCAWGVWIVVVLMISVFAVFLWCRRSMCQWLIYE